MTDRLGPRSARPSIDDRAVSTALGYALTLGIATLLITGLIVGIGTFIDDQRQQTTREELRVVGQQLATDIEAVDRLIPRANGIDDDGDGTVDEPDDQRIVDTIRLSRSLPDRVTGLQYTIALRDLPGSGNLRQIVLRPTDLDIVVRINVRTTTPIFDALADPDVSQRVGGGDVVLEAADPDGDGDPELVVNEG